LFYFQGINFRCYGWYLKFIIVHISNIITAVIVGWRREQAQCTPIHIAGVTWE